MINYFYPCKPVYVHPTSSLAQKLDNNKEWVAELKKNGWRCLVYKSGNNLTLYTRHHTIINDPLPEIREYFLQVPGNFIVDGELIEKRTKHFKGLFYAFDILYKNNTLLVNMPLVLRREMLDELLPSHGSIVTPTWVIENKLELYNSTINSEVDEGIVVKKLDSKYKISSTSCQPYSLWLKIKQANR